MIKLSKSGWNNVIIFSVMGFILLINMTHNNVFSNKDTGNAESYIFPENAVILTLAINQQIQVERIGKTWRATPSVISNQPLEQMMLAWQQSTGQYIEPPTGLDPQLALKVSAYVAGQAQEISLDVYTNNHSVIIFNHVNKKWLMLPLQLYSQLFPNALFESEFENK